MRIKIFVFFVITLLISACNSGDEGKVSNQSASNSFEQNTPKGQASYSDDVSAKNILQVAEGSKDHTTLVAAVQAAGIEHVLVNAGPLTVFAPTNAAFDALPEGTVETLLKPENKSKLAFILTNHAAPGSFNLKALKKEAKKGRKIYTAAGDYLEVKVDGDDVYVGGAKVLASIQTSNGVIDVVDKVILPKEK
ncbi:MAG: fasciclin domain-containing protein [Chlorobi bacterium]|nr:fasciclin domain-containing protein [Chlorobiota bacterium]